jgi:hypothetical protein
MNRQDAKGAKKKTTERYFSGSLKSAARRAVNSEFISSAWRSWRLGGSLQHLLF